MAQYNHARTMARLAGQQSGGSGSKSSKKKGLQFQGSNQTAQLVRQVAREFIAQVSGGIPQQSWSSQQQQGQPGVLIITGEYDELMQAKQLLGVGVILKTTDS